MHKHHIQNIPITLDGLNHKLDLEVKRLVQQKEEGIADYVSRTSVLNGISKLVFKKRNGTKITLSYRLDEGGALRFAREKKFANPPSDQKRSATAPVGRTSGDITG